MGNVKYILGVFMMLFFQICFSNGVKSAENDPNKIVEEMIVEISVIQKNYHTEYASLHTKLLEINKKMASEISTEQKVTYLIKKEEIRTAIENLKFNTNTDISKIRYIKGLQIIKILYEKVLSLDHHFASVRTFTEINKMSNPNQYPEFEKIKELIAKKKDKKTGFDISTFLGTNPYISVISTFTNLLVSGLSKEEKDVELQKIDCVLDFTMRMQNDLNTIYFETAFLHSSNLTIKNNLEVLFKEYTKPINYALGLKECRNEDDWDAVSTKLSTYIEGMKKSPPQKQLKLQIDIEFPIDRLIQFVNQYNDFINEGGKFYQKFNTILNSYENQKQCETKLPIEYKKWKDDITVAVEKFNIAYKPVEINGSKMKEILYGINEFE